MYINKALEKRYFKYRSFWETWFKSCICCVFAMWRDPHKRYTWNKQYSWL